MEQSHLFRHFSMTYGNIFVSNFFNAHICWRAVNIHTPILAFSPRRHDALTQGDISSPPKSAMTKLLELIRNRARPRYEETITSFIECILEKNSIKFCRNISYFLLIPDSRAAFCSASRSVINL